MPVLLGGAALTRTYVERDLREVYDGRLFYGTRRVRGPAHARPADGDQAQRRRRPRVRPGARRARPAAARRASVADADGRAAAPLARRRRRQPGLHPAVPRRTGRQGHLARRDRRVRQRDGAVPQPVAVPARADDGRDRRGVQGAHPPEAARSSSPRPRRAACSCPQVVYGYFPANGDGDDLVDLDRRHRARASWPASTTRARRRRRSCASPTSSGRSTAARPTTPRSTSSRWARR